jgi:hypothetical protein
MNDEVNQFIVHRSSFILSKGVIECCQDTEKRAFFQLRFAQLATTGFKSRNESAVAVVFIIGTGV